MLGIIFTHGRMLAAYVIENQINWIKIDSKPHLNHQENYSAVFIKYFPEILDTALWHAYGNGMTPLESLPLVLVFPNDDDVVFLSEKQAILHWIEASPYRFSTVFVADSMSLLEQTLSKKNVNYLIFEALDKTVYSKSNIAEIQSFLNQQDWSRLGKKQGIEYIFQIILKEIKKKNIEITDALCDEVFSNLVNFDVNKKLIIKQLSYISNVSIDIKLSETRYYDLLTYERNFYQNILFFINIFAYSNFSLIFASDFYDNEVFKGFVSHFMQDFYKNGNEILYYSDDYIFESLLINSYSVITEKAQLKEGKTKHQLLSEIRLKCTDKRKFRSYYQKYVPIAASLGIPSDVLSQFLKQILFNQKSLSLIGEVVSSMKQKTTNTTPRTLTFLDFQNSHSQSKNKIIYKTFNAEIKSDNHSIEIVEDINSPNENGESLLNDFNENLDDDLKIFDENTMSFINEIAQFEQVFESNEFLYFKAMLNGQIKPSVVRLLKNNANDFAVSSFKNLHSREKSYFNNISVIHKAKKGFLYYYRDFIEGEPLESYVKRNGINKKYRLKDLSSIDLELMLELWRCIYSLKFNYANLNKNSFWITVHWRLPFRKEIEVNLIDIDTTESTKDEMENQLLIIFEELFGKNLTNEFIQQFKHN